jgi:hypothetical protein
MKKYHWLIALGISLVVLSVLLYTLHYVLFHDSHHIFIYMLGDIAFVPIEVLLVTLIIHRLLSVRERKARMTKLNMVIGAFFSDVGTDLLAEFARLDKKSKEIAKELLISDEWTLSKFNTVRRRLSSYEPDLEFGAEDLEKLKRFLGGKRDFLLRLLENPNMLEHESFTNLLWAVFHLTEELEKRDDLGSLPDSDIRHLRGDTRRAYAAALREWSAYMKHLMREYPYLFSLAVRTNPFDPDASPVVIT